MNIYERIVKSAGEPSNQYDLWLDTKTNPPVLKVWHGGKWVSISSGSGGGANPSDDSDAIHFSDYCLLTVDPNVPTVESGNRSVSFYPNEKANKILPLAFSGGTYVILATGEIILNVCDFYNDYITLSNEESDVGVLVITQERVSSATEDFPGLNITGPGYLLGVGREEPEG